MFVAFMGEIFQFMLWLLTLEEGFEGHWFSLPLPPLRTVGTSERELLAKDNEECPFADDIPPFAVAAIYLHSSYAHTAARTATALVQPSPDALRVVLVAAEQLSCWVVVQTNRTIYVLEGQILLCVEGPFYLCYYIGDESFLGPLNVVGLGVILSYSIGLANQETMPAETAEDGDGQCPCEDDWDDDDYCWWIWLTSLADV